MVGVCLRKIKKPSRSFKLKGCNTSYYYLSDDNERKKLNQYIKRCGEIINITDKRVVKKKDLVESSHLSKIKFGKRGAMIFSEQIINYYNADVKIHTQQETTSSLEKAKDDVITINPSNDKRNTIHHIKRYIARSFDIEEIFQINNWCKERIERIRQLTETPCNNGILRINPPAIQQGEQPMKRPSQLKQKKRIQPTLVSREL